MAASQARARRRECESGPRSCALAARDRPERAVPSLAVLGESCSWSGPPDPLWTKATRGIVSTFPEHRYANAFPDLWCILDCQRSVRALLRRPTIRCFAALGYRAGEALLYRLHRHCAACLDPELEPAGPQARCRTGSSWSCARCLGGPIWSAHTGPPLPTAWRRIAWNWMTHSYPVRSTTSPSYFRLVWRLRRSAASAANNL